jgi:hypothetical protein
LGELPEETTLVSEPQGIHPFVQLFIESSSDFNHLGKALLSAVEFDGIFWICYPKLS